MCPHCELRPWLSPHISALSWQDWLATPSCLQRPECLGARVFPSDPWGRATALPVPCRAVEVPQGSSLSPSEGLSGAVEIPPCAGRAVLPAGRVVMGNEGTLDLQTLAQFGDEPGLLEGEATGRRVPSDLCQRRQL